MNSIPFHKFSATGNDFILFDNRDHVVGVKLRARFEELCRRRTSIGADGVLLIEPSSEHDFHLRYFNADGGESTMCGNGARAAAFFAQYAGLAQSPMRFTVDDDVFEAEVQGHQVKLKMPWPRSVEQNLGVVEEAIFAESGYLDTGVPHFVLFVDNVSKTDVTTFGKKYRWHGRFQPGGANIDFVEVLDHHRIQVRTYERGVESETLSCGTGCVAAAYMASVEGRAELPTEVVTQGGILRVSANSAHENIYLEGGVTLVYEGKLATG